MAKNILSKKSGYELRMWLTFEIDKIQNEVHGYDIPSNSYNDGWEPKPTLSIQALMQKTANVNYHSIEIGSGVIEFWTHPAYEYVYICDRIGVDHVSLCTSKIVARKLWSTLSKLNK